MTYTPYIWPQVAAIALLIAMLTPARRFRRLPTIRPFILSLEMTLLAATFGLLDLATVELPLKILWSHLRFAAVAALPVAYLAVALAYVERVAWLTRRRLALLLVIPLATLLLAFAQPGSGLFRYAYHLHLVDQVPVLHWTDGAALRIYELYAGSLTLGACALLLYALHHREVRLGNTLALITALLATHVTHTLAVSTGPLLLTLSAETLSYVLAGGIGIWTLLRHQVLGIAPVAYSTVVATIADPVIVLDARQRIAIANPTAERLCGLPRHYAGITPDALPPEWAALFRRYATADYLREETRVGQGESERVYDLTISTFEGAGPRDRGQLFLLHDVTERKTAGARLRDSEARYRLLNENLLDVVWILDLDTYRFRYISASVERLRGYTVEEALTQDIAAAVTPASLAQLVPEIAARAARFRETGAGTYIDEIEQPHKDGTTLWTEITSRFVRNPETGHIEIFGVSRDIRDRKRAEAEVAHTQARLQSLVALLQYSAPSVQGYLDNALLEAIRLTESGIGYIYHYNESKREFTLNTWSPGVMAACAITEPETIYQLDKTGIWGEAVRQRRPIVVNDFHAPHPLKRGYPEGHAPLHRFMTVPVIQEDRIVAVVGLANKESAYDDTDVLQITLLMDTVWSVIDYRRAQEALQHYAQELEVQNQELDAFSHTVAHDLRNSLGGISGAVELLQEDRQNLPEDSAFAIDALMWSVQKLQTIVDELMLLSGVRKQTVTPVGLNMPAIVAEAQRRLQPQIQQTGATLTILDAAGWPVVLGHAPWTEEVWFNYLNNALKYGGTPPRIVVGADAQDEGTARFWVRDNGRGISPEDRTRLFMPFARLNQVRTQGHGLGLSIVQRIITKLGGQVGIESHNGDGSTFYFTLPLAPTDRVTQPPGDTAHGQDLKVTHPMPVS